MCVHMLECTPVFKYVHACIRGDVTAHLQSQGTTFPGSVLSFPLWVPEMELNSSPLISTSLESQLSWWPHNFF